MERHPTNVLDFERTTLSFIVFEMLFFLRRNVPMQYMWQFQNKVTFVTCIVKNFFALGSVMATHATDMHLHAHILRINATSI